MNDMTAKKIIDRLLNEAELPDFAELKAVYDYALSIGYTKKTYEPDPPRYITATLVNQAGMEISFYAMGLYGGGVNYWIMPESQKQSRPNADMNPERGALSYNSHKEAKKRLQELLSVEEQ